VAVYAEPDADAPHVRLADEAFALGGFGRRRSSYLDFGKLLEAAEKSGANAIHPRLRLPVREPPTSLQAVIDAGLIWIGPSPQSIRDLGDKVTARHIRSPGRRPRWWPGTAPDPVKNADEVVAFAKEYGSADRDQGRPSAAGGRGHEGGPHHRGDPRNLFESANPRGRSRRSAAANASSSATLGQAAPTSRRR